MAEWQRWPAASVEPFTLLNTEIDPVTGRALRERQVPGLLIWRNRDAGVPYILSAHSACWRSYGELAALQAPAFDQSGPVLRAQPPLVSAVRRFARAYGPLVSALCVSEAFGSLAFQTASEFRALASLWGAPDADGVSRWVVPRNTQHGVVEWLHSWLAHDRAPPPGTLLRFMLIQALRQYDEATPHRRCLGCGDWIELTRADRRFCDPACRKAYSRQQEH
jgi:hypothetical protein